MQPVRERYFMSEDQEAAAKWQMFENYKKLNSQRAVIKQQLQQWSQVLASVAEIISNPPTTSTNMIFMERYPSREDISRAMQENWSLTSQINTLKSNLRLAGMDLD
jgi:hypothetical protein